METYKNIDDWKSNVLKKHKTAEFNDNGYSISASVKTGAITTMHVGFISVKNLKGLIHS